MNAAALILAATLVQQSPCGPTGAVEKRIKEQYGESIVGAGIAANGIMFLTANPETGTWTILLRKGGQTCVLQGGTGFATLEAVKPGDDL